MDALLVDLTLEKCAESSEYAPGIPAKEVSHELPEVSEPARWEYAVHDHRAERRGHHLDLRLGDPSTGRAHSWAMGVRWPVPGESAWAIQQPTHTVKYMDFEGKIEEGYGKGDVHLRDRDKAEITSARPGHVSFNLYGTGGPEEYTLHRISGKQWKLYNRTPVRSILDLPSGKPKYRSVDVENARKYVDDEDWIASAKIDDAHNLIVMGPTGSKIRVTSYRIPKRGTTGIIDHTHKIPGLATATVPPELANTVIRGGVYAMHPATGRATEAKDLAGMLNTTTWKSRDKQDRLGKLRIVAYDVVKFRGKPMEDAGYADKLKALRAASAAVPAIELPRMAESEVGKKKLIRDVAAGNVPETREGVVFWNLRTAVPPVKAKFSADHDVHVRGFFPGEGRYRGEGVGGFTYSHSPDGPVVGRVGTGLSDALRRDMHDNPGKYVGLVARVTAQEKFPSGALRAPAFENWHLDKNLPEDLEGVES